MEGVLEDLDLVPSSPSFFISLERPLVVALVKEVFTSFVLFFVAEFDRVYDEVEDDFPLPLLVSFALSLFVPLFLPISVDELSPFLLTDDDREETGFAILVVLTTVAVFDLEDGLSSLVEELFLYDEAIGSLAFLPFLSSAFFFPSLRLTYVLSVTEEPRVVDCTFVLAYLKLFLRVLDALDFLELELRLLEREEEEAAEVDFYFLPPRFFFDSYGSFFAFHFLISIWYSSFSLSEASL